MEKQIEIGLRNIDCIKKNFNTKTVTQWKTNKDMDIDRETERDRDIEINRRTDRHRDNESRKRK